METFESREQDLIEISAFKRKHQIDCENRLDGGEEEPKRLENGKWPCNHRCKNKDT